VAGEGAFKRDGGWRGLYQRGDRALGEVRGQEDGVRTRARAVVVVGGGRS
jgi:hypothetical protein